MPNALQYETSPYLLQHANNPVNWYPWGEKAIALAKQTNMPILVSIGYAACHWCHVMEHESFENEATAAIMNSHFVNIKIDREERPDIDHIYMDALQAMTGSGGWPLNVFLTPDLKPFYGGTYFPPVNAYNRSSWTDVLMGVAKAWNERKNEIEAQADELTAHLLQANSFGAVASNNDLAVNATLLKNINEVLLKNADTVNGGFGAAPKFPQLHTITYLLRHYHFFGDKNSLLQAELSLTKMIEGGIYDQLAGGLARYSTDNEWLVPHFEKMLYDNALFIQTLAEAYQITNNDLYKKVIDETIAFVQQDLMHDNNLFYAAIDADSEGVEGKYYCWTNEELHQLLTPLEASIFAAYYDVSPKGNFTEPHHNITTNILHINTSINAIAKAKELTNKEVTDLLNNAKAKLLTARKKRVPPLTDDKCLLGWNALMNTALVKAYKATQNEAYKALAILNWQAIVKHFIVTDNQNSISTLYHTYKNNSATITAFADDIAYTAEAAISLYNATLDIAYLTTAQHLVNYALQHYKDEESPYFFYAHQLEQHTLVRKKEIYDGATPSANAVMASVLIDLSTINDLAMLFENANKMLKNILPAIAKHPSSFAVWAAVAQKIHFGVNQININNTNSHSLIFFHYIPYSMIMSNLGIKNTEIMLCKQHTCYAPNTTKDALLNQIGEAEKGCINL